MARRLGLDLVEISASAKPPVCRILDFGKYRYQQAKKGKDAKTQRTRNKVKEVKFRVRIEDHDYFTKIKRAEDFLGKGNKVKLSLMFRGREIEHKDLGFDTIARAVGEPRPHRSSGYPATAGWAFYQHHGISPSGESARFQVQRTRTGGLNFE